MFSTVAETLGEVRSCGGNYVEVLSTSFTVVSADTF
jgi:hypothetical protein